MPNYERFGKIEQPISPEDWLDTMSQGHFTQRKHKGYCATLYYFAVRCSEPLKTIKEQFKIIEASNELAYDVGKRLKHSKTTPTLTIRLDLPYVDEIVWTIEHTKPKSRVWPYSRQTGYNIITRVFPSYPHFFRLSRITQMFEAGWTVPEVQTWTGLTLNALNYYIGLANIREKGKTIE